MIPLNTTINSIFKPSKNEVNPKKEPPSSENNSIFSSENISSQKPSLENSFSSEQSIDEKIKYPIIPNTLPPPPQFQKSFSHDQYSRTLSKEEYLPSHYNENIYPSKKSYLPLRATEKPYKYIEADDETESILQKNIFVDFHKMNLPSQATANSFSSTLRSNEKMNLPSQAKENPTETNKLNNPSTKQEYSDSDSDTSSTELKENTIKVLQNLKIGKSINVFLCLYTIDTSCYIESIFLNEENDLSDIPFEFGVSTEEINNLTRINSLSTYRPSNSLTPNQLGGGASSDDISSKKPLNMFSKNKYLLNMNFPFVKYLLKDNTFPFFLFNNEHFSDSTNVNIEFETECIKELSNIITNIHDLTLNKVTDLYKGVYVVEDTDESTGEPYIYAFFDISTFRFENSLSSQSQSLTFLAEASPKPKMNFSKQSAEKLQKEIISLGKNMVWATIDEIIYRKTINGFNINDDVIDLFNKQKYFKTIFSLENRSFPTPFQLYLCKNDKEMASNEPNETLALSNVLMGEPILPFEHPLLGYGYFFTSEPLANTSNINNLQRFSCFIVNCFYAFNLSKESLKITFNEEPSTTTTTSNDDISIVLSSLRTSDTSLTNEKEEINGVHESNEILENIMAASSVYFNENGVQYWFIKNISHFTKI